MNQKRLLFFLMYDIASLIYKHQGQVILFQDESFFTKGEKMQNSIYNE